MDIPPREAAKLTAFLKTFVAAVDKARKQMGKDQVEIDRLKVETRAMLAELKALR